MSRPVNTKEEWWSLRRRKLNTGLMLSGILAIIVTALLFYPLDETWKKSLFALLYGLLFYIIYMAVVHFIFLGLEFLDRSLSRTGDGKNPDQFFKYFYIAALTLPFAYPLFMMAVAY